MTLSSGSVGNYEVTYESGTLIVDAKPLTVTAASQFVNFGEPVAAVTILSAESLHGSDAVESFGVSFTGVEGTTYGPSSEVPTAAGEYSITLTGVAVGASGAATANYAITAVNGTLTIAAPNAVRIDPDEGLTSGGLPFEITGSGFGSETPVVRFGITPATEVVLTSDGRITGLTPEHLAGTVTVEVDIVGGGTTRLVDAYTYVEPIPGPVVLSMSPAFGPVAGGTEVTITGANLVGSDGTAAMLVIGDVVVDNVRVTEDGSSLVAVTPPAPQGPRDVDVATTDGGVRFVDGFTYIPGPADIPGTPDVPGTPGGLASTGAEPGSLVALAGLLILAGLAAVLGPRRRRGIHAI
jgi:LPXTG-motif cell wall-anchored protein